MDATASQTNPQPSPFALPTIVSVSQNNPEVENMEVVFQCAREKMANFPWQEIYGLNVPILIFKNSTDPIPIGDDY